MQYTKDDIELIAQTANVETRDVRQYLRGMHVCKGAARDIADAMQELKGYFDVQDDEPDHMVADFGDDEEE